jgi:choline dehydrogenase
MKVVIVGGGSAGLFCALGLAEIAEVTLIEAGHDPGSPAPDRYLHEHLYPDCDWDYVEADRGYHLVRGKVLGGSSTVNASAAVRGQPNCLSTWGPGWSWDDLLPALVAIETDEQFGAEPYHGTSGPVHVTRLSQGPLDGSFHRACLDAGYPACDDHNAPGAFGTGPWPTNRLGGGRWGTLAAVAPLVRDRIALLAETQVVRVVVESDRVVGVEVRVPGGVHTIPADVVVLSGGAFGTPELLWRSGLDLPGVGVGLQDHPWVMLDASCDPDALARRPVSGGLLRYANGDDIDDEIQIFPFSASIYEPGTDASTYRMSVGLMGPRSVGGLDQGPDDRAVVHLGHLNQSSDADRLAAGVAVAGELLDAMAAEGTIGIPADPWWKAGDLRAEVVTRVGTYNHPVGTCGIGRAVDQRLRVPGIAGLRIADASVMPQIVRSNTNLVTMAIGLRAAWFLAEDEGLGTPWGLVTSAAA